MGVCVFYEFAGPCHRLNLFYVHLELKVNGLISLPNVKTGCWRCHGDIGGPVLAAHLLLRGEALDTFANGGLAAADGLFGKIEFGPLNDGIAGLGLVGLNLFFVLEGGAIEGVFAGVVVPDFVVGGHEDAFLLDHVFDPHGAG